MEKKKLTRSQNKMLGGVCAGLAEYFDIDPTLVRVIYAACSVFSAGFPGLFALSAPAHYHAQQRRIDRLW